MMESQHHFHGHQRRQQHPQGEAQMNNYPNFLLPETQNNAFIFAEPGMMDVSLVPPGSAPGSAYAATSYDSEQLMNYSSYPPADNYISPNQNYSLSPQSHTRNGQSISPSHSIDQLTSEFGGYDPSQSSYTNTPANYNGLDIGSLEITDQHLGTGPLDNFNLLSPDILAAINAQSFPVSHNASQSSFHSHPPLMSPSPTNNSSPIINDDNSASINITGMQYSRNDPQAVSTPPTHTPAAMFSTPTKQQQQQTPPRAHHPSPIFRIERAGSPSPSDASRPVSKRSHNSRRSGNHLSPFPVDESSSDEDDDNHQGQVRLQRVSVSAERNEDGSWRPNEESGHAGLAPGEREAMSDLYGPTINQIIEQRAKDDKRVDVQNWLSKSEACSENGDNGPDNLLKPSFPTRRRAKSTNDAHRQPFHDFGLGVRTDFDHFDDSNIPGPGLYLEVASVYEDYDDEDDEYDTGSLPAEVEPFTGNAVDSYFPPEVENALLATSARPWVDPPVSRQPPSETRNQPPTANAAVMLFQSRARDAETASLAATLGSDRRRLSESDLGSIRQAPGVIKVIPDPKKKLGPRRPSFLENLIPKRGAPGNILKRKGSIPVQTPPEEKNKELTNPKPPSRIGSWGRPKSPRVDTSVANLGRDVGPPSATGLSPGPWYNNAKNAIRRSRSKSDLGKQGGLIALMTQHGGPPMPMLASPGAETEATRALPQPSPGADDDDDEDGQEAVAMDLKVRFDPIIPTYEGFKTHARQLNPRLVDYMVERITQEQMRRYKRLLEFKVKHLNAVKNRNCASHGFCTELGGESKQLPPRAGNKDSEAPFIGFQITAPGSSDDDGEPPPEGTVVAAQFPSGVPLPPVKRLPAEFECPLCFKVKKFYKPSDWTKHVHEDVQPFTCTFPNCGEPKSFKRKADWVRHENERHRQLENWTCQIADCSHTCYRKDNFVQHLVREHKIAEPRARVARGGNKDIPGGSQQDDIWSLVERCRRDTTKQPKDEPCRFCGNICNSWKKLTVHLAKHMEQISMPILPLVEQKQMNADTIISPVVEMPESRRISATPNRSPIDNPSRYNPTSTFAPGLNPAFAHYPQEASPPIPPPTAVMHSYPPPQLMALKNQNPARNGNYNTYGMGDPNANYTTNATAGRTYPGLHEAPKPKGGYMNELQIPSQQAYHPNGVYTQNVNVNGGVMNHSGVGVPMTPVSATSQHNQQNQPVFTTSPVDSTPFSGNNLGVGGGVGHQYFTQEPQAMMNGVGVGGYDTGAGGQQQQQQQQFQYHDMPYLTGQQQQQQQQQHYQYQG